MNILDIFSTKKSVYCPSITIQKGIKQNQVTFFVFILLTYMKLYTITEYNNFILFKWHFSMPNSINWPFLENRFCFQTTNLNNLKTLNYWMAFLVVVGTLLHRQSSNIIDLDIIYNQYNWQQENITKITMGQVVWGLYRNKNLSFKSYCIRWWRLLGWWSKFLLVIKSCKKC